MGSLIQVSDSNAIVNLSPTTLYSQLTTIRDIGGNRSSSNTITVNTINGLSFSDGSTSILIDTPYASITVDSTAKLLHASPFTNGQSTDLEGLSVQSDVSLTGPLYVYDSMYISNTLSSIGRVDVQSLRIGSDTIVGTSILYSTVSGLDNLYTIKFIFPIDIFRPIYTYCNDLYSTVGGLGQVYISSATLQSTTNTLGVSYRYISTSQLVSSVNGYSNILIKSSNIQSTVIGVGVSGYISSQYFLSTTSGIGKEYISPSNYTSTVAGLSLAGYVSTTQFYSTIQGLGQRYISIPSLFSTTAGLSVLCNAQSFVSTVNGLGQIYMSRSHLTSTVSGITLYNGTVLTSTVNGLGQNYISTNQLTSTVQGLSNIYVLTSNLTNNVTAHGSSNTGIFISTVQGLGVTYVSSLQIPGLSLPVNEAVDLISTYSGLGENYLSTTGLFSTVTGLSNTYIKFVDIIPEVTIALANVSATSFVATSNLASTVAGLATLSPNGYISTTQLISTVSNIHITNLSLFSKEMPHIANIPYSYISTISLISTMTTLSNILIPIPKVISTVAGLNSNFNSNSIQTTSGLGLATIPNVSTTQLVSTVSNIINSNNALFVQRMTHLANSPYFYISSPSLLSTVNNFAIEYALFSNIMPTIGSLPLNLVSTVNGLATMVSNGFISTGNLVSSVTYVARSNSAFFSQTLSNTFVSIPSIISTVQGIGRNYISLPALTTGISNYLFSQNYTNEQLTSSINNLGTKGYYSTPSLTSTFNGLGNLGYIENNVLINCNTAIQDTYVLSNTAPTTYTTITNNYSLTLSNILASTVRGLGTSGYISTSTIAPIKYNPPYLIFPTYISSLYASQRVVLISTTLGVASNLSNTALPVETGSNISITPQTTSNLIYIYQSNTGLTATSNIRVTADGIQMCNVYSRCNITSSTFFANNFYADGTQLVYGSDRRSKYNIISLSNALSTIMELQGYRYKMVDDPDKYFLGFLAQDMEKICPELVFTRNEVKSIKYDSIGVIVLEGIKELNLQCDELLSTITRYTSTLCPTTHQS